MVMNVRDNETYLEIDFSDHSELKTYSLAANQIAAGTDLSNYVIDHVYLVESYAEGCHLVVEIDHQFVQQVCHYKHIYSTNRQLYNCLQKLESKIPGI